MENVILNYLSMETSYALLINGKRGIGKTFFIKEKIIPQIKKLATLHDPQKKYKPIYISLYGLKNIEDVYKAMAIEFMTWLKQKGIKVAPAMSKIVARGMLNLKIGDAMESKLAELPSKSQHAMDTKDFVIILDDLDRISDSLGINEVIGFVNSLVEHDNNKIMVIADEEHLNSSQAYLAVREKTIGTVIEYSATFITNFQSIIDSKYKKRHPLFYQYLLLLKDDLLYWFQSTSTENLRTLIYFLEHFYEVFKKVEVPLALTTVDLESLSFRKLRAILHFSAAISIEFKKGEISYKHTKGIDDMRAIGEVLMGKQLKEMFADHQRSSQLDNEQKLPPNYRDKFLANFYSHQEYQFYQALYNFITGGNDLDTADLLAQLKKNFDDRIFTPSEQDQVYNQLSDPQVLDLPDVEYMRLTDQMLHFAYVGEYPLDRYISVLFYAMRYPEIIEYEINETVDKLIAGVQGSSAKFKYIDHLSHSFGFKENNPHYQVYLKLHRALNEVNNGIDKARLENIRADTLKEFIEKPEQFYNKIQSYYDYDMPMLAYWNFDRFYTHFQTLKTSELPRFRRLLKGRFGEVLIKERMEYYFLENLYDKVTKIDDKVPTMREIEFKSLATLLQDILTRNHALKETK
ncbi:P-loop NTPase fold protein [Mucilaginibacter ximonensis]|uniref:P-loop NTPase fold protein n=1 Tax=Mucilaginibacter ximonensis TaxID=538021 RepID=A0ABW5Y9Q3_9SPHI